MDILNRKVLKKGDSCYFYVSSVESPYIYVKFKGIVEEKHSIKERQIIYRLRVVEILEDDINVSNYINGNSYRAYDLGRKVNTTKTFYNFDLTDKSKFIEKRFDGKYYLECSSASVFETENEMIVNLKETNKFIKELLLDTIKELNIRS